MAESNFDPKFNFKFLQHKSLIPVGIDDTDYKRLAAVYGVTYEDILSYVKEFDESNAKYVKKLKDTVDVSFFDGKKLRIAFLGDSITADRQSYMNIIKKLFEGNEDIVIGDFAISGLKSVDLFTAFHPDIKAFNADVAHIMIGTNDFRRYNDERKVFHALPEEYEKNIDYIIGEFVKAETKVVISTIPPFSAKKLDGKLVDFKILYQEEDRQLYNGIIDKVAAKYGVTVNHMDQYYAEYTPEEFTEPEGLHLGPLGHELMSREVLKSIIKVLS